MDDKNKKIQIALDNNDLNVIQATIDHSNAVSLKSFPNVESIANEGLSNIQWLTLKSLIEKIVFASVSENGAPITWNKENILKKINDKLS